MEIAGFDLTELGLIITSLSSVTGFVWGFIERKEKRKAQIVSLKSDKLSNIEKLEKFLMDDIENIQSVNNVFKWIIETKEEEIEKLKQENLKLKDGL